MAAPATAAEPVRRTLDTTARIINIASRSLPGGAEVVPPPPATRTERVMQQGQAAKLAGAIGVGGIATGLLAKRRMLPVKSLNTKAAAYSAISVGIFALLIAALVHYKRTREMEEGSDTTPA